MSKFIDRPRYLCALGGALATLRAIPRVIPILHASAGCGGNLATALNGGSGLGGNGYCGGQSLPSSNVTEKEVVFGGVDRLKEQIESTLEVMDGDLYVVVTGCVVEVIGDDVHSAVSQFNKRREELGDKLPPLQGLDKVVIDVSTPSFHGNSYTGYDMIMAALAERYIPKIANKKKNKVNILGIAPMLDPSWSGNLRELKYILQRIGIEVNTFFGEGETLEDIKNSSNSALNVVVSDIYGIDTAKAFEEYHGIPYITTPFPIGSLATEKFVWTVGEKLGVDKEIIRRVIDEENSIYFDYLDRISEDYSDGNLQRYAVVVGDANYSQAVTRFISDELGFLPKLAVVTDLVDDQQKEILTERFKDLESGLEVVVRFDTDTSAVKRHFNEIWPQNSGAKYYDEFSPAVVFGSIFDQDFSEALKAPLIQTTFPISAKAILDKPYAGFRGGLNLTSEIFTTILTTAIKLNKF